MYRALKRIEHYDPEAEVLHQSNPGDEDVEYLPEEKAQLYLELGIIEPLEPQLVEGGVEDVSEAAEEVEDDVDVSEGAEDVVEEVEDLEGAEDVEDAVIWPDGLPPIALAGLEEEGVAPEEIRGMSDHELLEVPGVGRGSLQILREAFGGPPEEDGGDA